MSKPKALALLVTNQKVINEKEAMTAFLKGCEP
jgi:hypothetical protein